MAAVSLMGVKVFISGATLNDSTLTEREGAYFLRRAE
jgi:hypothetical protein